MVTPPYEMKIDCGRDAQGRILVPDMVVFLDTETDGLPRDERSSAASVRKNWPHLVQLAWIVTDGEGNAVSRQSRIVRPEGFTIPGESSAIHGITEEVALREGLPLGAVMGEFRDVISGGPLLVGHNLWFDLNVVAEGMLDSGLDAGLLQYPGFCTMDGTVEICRLPPRTKPAPGSIYKRPRLSELYSFLFGEPYHGAHNAENDVEATAKCFWKLVRSGLI